MSCLNCKKELVRRQKKFCSPKCQMELRYKEYIKRWKNGEEDGIKGNKVLEISDYIRRYLFEKYVDRCQKCGWNKKNIYTQNIPIEIHHIDGDYLNNIEDNLTLLCPNCHSLTSNYKGRGKGRSYRNK